MCPGLLRVLMYPGFGRRGQGSQFPARRTDRGTRKLPPPFTTSAPWLFSKPLHVLGERQHVLGQRERGWREVGRKEVRKVEEMRGVEGGGGGEEGLEGGV